MKQRSKRSASTIKWDLYAYVYAKLILGNQESF